MTEAAVNRYTEFEAEPTTHDLWAVFGKGSDYPIAHGLKDDIEIITDLLNKRTAILEKTE